MIENDRPLPHDRAAEGAILSALMADFDNVGYLDRAAAIVEPRDFSHFANRTVYEAVLDLANEGCAVDEITVANRLRDKGLLEQAGGVSHLVSFRLVHDPETRIEKYAMSVREKANRRRAIIAAESVVLAADKEGFDVAANEALDALSVATSPTVANSRPVNAADFADQGLAAIYARAKNPDRLTGVNSGFHSINLVSGGYVRGGLTLGAARTRCGKTAFAVNSVVNLLRANPSARVHFVSLEMSKELLFPRFAAPLSGVSCYRIRTGKYLTDIDKAKLEEARAFLRSAKDRLTVVDDIRDISRISRHVRRAARESLDLVVVDYVQIVKGGRGKSRQIELGDIAMRLLDLAREANVAVLGLAQLNRGGALDEVPTLENVREADDLVHTARTVILLDRPALRRQQKRPCELLVSLAKVGEGEERDLEMHFDLDHQTIEEGGCYAGCRFYAFDQIREAS